MGLRELKETAHKQFVRGKFTQCAQTYQQVLRLAPKDPNMRVRHAEACRRAGERLQAIASYRAAAELLLELGCESRARGALKAALELDPKDPLLLAEVARLGPHAEETVSHLYTEPEELPLLPPLESAVDPIPPHVPAPHVLRGMPLEVLLQTPALPPIHRALPAAPSVPPLVPPVLLPAPRVPSVGASSATEKMGVALVSAARTQASRAQPAPSHSRAASKTPRSIIPPPPPPEALIDAAVGAPLPPPALEAAVPAPAKESSPRLEIRRLSPTSLAFRSSPDDAWAVIRSHTPLEMHVVESLDQLPPMLRDCSGDLDITVENPPEAATNTVH